MKNFTLLLIFTFSISFLSAQNKEEEAIKKVVIAETDAYIKRDAKAFLACYVEGTAFTFMGTPNGNPGSIMAGTDIQKFSKGMAGMMETNKVSEMLVESRDGWVCRIKGEMAWISYDQKNIMVKTGAKIKSKELKVLEKVDGQWKITSSSTVWDFAHAEYSTPNLEEEAIKAVIIKQFESFRDGDFEAWQDVFVHEPYLTWSVTNGGEPGDVLTARGWDALKEIMQKGFEAKAKAPKTPNTTKVSRDQWNIQIRGNLAYVSYNQHSENEEKQTKINSTETRILEKIKGVWKITTQTSLADFKDATPPIRTKY
jgi:ketosteroid isomerase-like protein